MSKDVRKSVERKGRGVTLPLVFFGVGILLASMFLVRKDLDGDERVILRISLIVLILIFLGITLQIKRAAAKRRRLIAGAISEAS